MSLMLSELINAACATFENFGDMPVFIDREEDEYECNAIEMRRETGPKPDQLSFVIADYIYKVNQLRLVK